MPYHIELAVLVPNGGLSLPNKPAADPMDVLAELELLDQGSLFVLIVPW